MIGLWAARRGPKVDEAVGRVIGRLLQPVAPRADGQVEPVQELVIKLSKDRAIILRGRVVLRPDQIVRPAGGRGETLRVGVRNEEAHVAVREKHTRGAGQVVDRIERYARLLGGLAVVVLSVPRIGLIGHGVGTVVVVVEELLGAVARVLEVMRVTVEIAGRGYDVEAISLVGQVQRRQCPSIEGVGLHIEVAVDRVLRNELRVRWAVSLVRVGKGREGRRKPVILCVLIQNTQAPLEIVRYLEQQRDRAAVARIRPLIADAGAGYVRERQRNDVADGAALRRVGERAR